MLRGLLATAKGRQGLPEPNGWPAAYQKLTADADPTVREQARSLALIFGSSTAFDEFRTLLANKTASADSRREALGALVARRDAALLEPLLGPAHEGRTAAGPCVACPRPVDRGSPAQGLRPMAHEKLRCAQPIQRRTAGRDRPLP